MIKSSNLVSVVFTLPLSFGLMSCRKEGPFPTSLATGPSTPPSSQTTLPTTIPQLPISIISATFGTRDVTQQVSTICQNTIGVCTVFVTNAHWGDPLPGYTKRFTAIYTCGTSTQPMFVQVGNNEVLPIVSGNNSDGLTVNLYCGAPAVGNQMINIQTASFGASNVQPYLQNVCGGSVAQCQFTTSNQFLGDPMPGWTKRFTSTYTCGSDPTTYIVQFGDNRVVNGGSLGSNADGVTQVFNCPGSIPTKNQISIVNATFAAAQFILNITSDVSKDCNGAFNGCNYTPMSSNLGDPEPGYAKQVTIQYSCDNSSTIKTLQYGVSGGAAGSPNADGTTVSLSCP